MASQSARPTTMKRTCNIRRARLLPYTSRLRSWLMSVAGEFLTEDFELQPLFLRRGNFLLQLTKGGGDFFKRGAVARVELRDRRAWLAARWLPLGVWRWFSGRVSSACLSLKLISAALCGVVPLRRTRVVLAAFCGSGLGCSASDRRHAAPACRYSRRHIRSSGRCPPARSRRLTRRSRKSRSWLMSRTVPG